jgi:hypothetical protein
MDPGPPRVRQQPRQLHGLDFGTGHSKMTSERREQTCDGR